MFSEQQTMAAKSTQKNDKRAAALRENLKRRKVQAKEQAKPEGKAPSSASKQDDKG